MPGSAVSAVQTALDVSSFDAIALRMRCLMLRNIAGAEYRFVDPDGAVSEPGCIIASPSYPRNDPGTDQDYVFNWTRDAALTAMELRAQGLATAGFARDYVAFAARCQAAAAEAGDFARACFRVDGAVRAWSAQTDGPALQTMAVLALWDVLGDDAREQARGLVAANLAFLLSAYTGETVTLWEEPDRRGASFFARSVQLRCFREIEANTRGLPVPAGVTEAIAWLEAALEDHWDGDRYLSLVPRSGGFDPNIDIVLAALYGAVATTDPKLLATAARLHEQWSPGGDRAYAINAADRDRGIGPLLGRYPEDVYDGDIYGDPNTVGHPWALCTCAFAELCHRVARDVEAGAAPASDPVAARFFDRLGRDAAALRDAGDRMLRAVVFHSDHLELSEQFDRDTGFEKSVRDLTWSYSAFLSAVRARAALGVA